MAEKAYQHDPKNDPSLYVRYKVGKDDAGVELNAPAVMAMGEDEFVKTNLGAHATDEAKDEPILFAGMKRAGREQHLRAAFKMASEHAATLQPVQSGSETNTETGGTGARRASRPATSGNQATQEAQ